MKEMNMNMRIAISHFMVKSWSQERETRGFNPKGIEFM